MPAVNSNTTGRSRRRFIRHPADVPLEIAIIAVEKGFTVGTVFDVGYGGISFIRDAAIEPGTELNLRIPYLQEPFHARVRVVWCRRECRQYRIGVRFFEESDAYRSRMVEQVCAIESYRQRVHHRDGRELTGAEAAQEWIAKYAADFPEPD